MSSTLSDRLLQATAREYGEQLAEIHTHSDRKSSASYYTPETLVECLIDTALQPLIDEARGLPGDGGTRVDRSAYRKMLAEDPVPAKASIDRLLELTVCDPSCGSGAFLVGAARRIATALAEECTALSAPGQRTWWGAPAPTAETKRAALREVVETCIYGVDLSEMAAELAKVTLWLTVFHPDMPNVELSERIRVGNALLGTTPALMAGGLPDAAFDPIEGDDKKIAAALKARNRAERDDPGTLF